MNPPAPSPTPIVSPAAKSSTSPQFTCRISVDDPASAARAAGPSSGGGPTTLVHNRVQRHPYGRHLRLSVPGVSARVSMEVVASTLARLIASRAAVTRADLVRVTGLARSTVTSALDMLERAGVVRPVGARPTTGRGRPGEDLGLSPAVGVILVADLGVHVARLSVHDFGQELLTSLEVRLDVARGPEEARATVSEVFRDMLTRIAHPRPVPLALVIGLPAPVDTNRGIPVKPPLMPGWDSYPVADTLRTEFGCPVLVENDVNLRAFGEARALGPDQSRLLYIKASTGIGGGLVMSSGELYHGADGSAADIGHIRVPDARDVLCRCGNYGCIEAVASAPAVLRRLRQLDASEDSLPTTQDELRSAVGVNDERTVGLIREAAERIGEVVASLVQFYNPTRIVVGGGLTVPSDDLLVGIRAVVYRRALPLGTRNLIINAPVFGEWSGVGGGLVLGIEHTLTPDALTPALNDRDYPFHPVDDGTNVPYPRTDPVAKVG